MKKLVLTFDYEVFLGQSGSIHNCILEPTNKLLKLFKSKNIRGVFFIDVLFLFKLKEAGLQDQFNLLAQNIQDILKGGNEIGLHLHPHWFDADYNQIICQWDLSNDSRYKVSCFTPAEISIMFNDSMSLLSEICNQVKRGYRIESFRAGGLCIQPFEAFKESLEKHKLYNESSVAIGLKNRERNQSFDFEQAKLKSPYRFFNNPLEQNDSGSFIQYPIQTYRVRFIQKIAQKLMGNSPVHKIFGDGKSVKAKCNNHSKSILDRFKPSVHLYSLDGDYYSSILFKKIKKNPEEVLTILSHPKLLSNNSLKFIEKLSDSQLFSFCTLQEISDSMFHSNQ